MKLLVAVSLGIIAVTGALVAQGAPPARFMVPATRTTDGRPPVRVAMKAGDFDWHTGARTHAIVNAGTTPFEAIEVVWK